MNRFPLSPNFSLGELTRSVYALRIGEMNVPSDQHVDALRALCINVLQPVRNQFGRTRINSGFRSPEINKAIGGVSASQHLLGQAADFEVPGVDNRRIALWVASELEFDQLILEHYVPGGGVNSGWIHVSYVAQRLGERPNRGQVLSKNAGQSARVGLPR